VILTPLVFVCWLSFSNEIVTFPPQGYTLHGSLIFDQNNFVSGFLTGLQVGIVAWSAGSPWACRQASCWRDDGSRDVKLNSSFSVPAVVPGIVAGTAIYQIPKSSSQPSCSFESRAGSQRAHRDALRGRYASDHDLAETDRWIETAENL
jgi:ABC-type spermidine/putrescine transport system permease subunit II